MKFRRIVSAALAAIIACGALMTAASAEEVQIATVEQTYGKEGDVIEKGDLKFTELSDGTLSVSRAHTNNLIEFQQQAEKMTKIDIPSEVNGKKVTEIGSIGFMYCKNLKTVTIPNSVKIIRDGAFVGTALESITIPNSVIAIGYNAFTDCKNLKSVTLPDSVKALGEDVFSETPFLNNQTGTVKYAGNWAIDFDKTAKSIVLKDGTIGIACRLTDHKAKAITIPSSVVSLDDLGVDNIYHRDFGDQILFYSDILDIYYGGTEAQWKKLVGNWNGEYYEYDNGELQIYHPTVHYNAKPTAPANIKVSKTESTLKLSWDKVSGATSYIVKYSTDNKTWKSMTVTSNSAMVYRLKANTKYYYKVAAKNDKGTGSYTKTYSSTTSKAATAKPAKVTGVKATPSKTSVKLTWSKASGVVEYYVDYSTDGKTWKSKTVTEASATISGLKANTKYYFKVAAKNSKGTGTYSAQVTTTTKK